MYYFFGQNPIHHLGKYVCILDFKSHENGKQTLQNPLKMLSNNGKIVQQEMISPKDKIKVF